ncbi:MAG: TlpA disulfide reductase family protein [Planctomycetota bacterium]
MHMEALAGRKNLILVILAAICLALPAQAAESDDALLNTLPQDSMFCLRINNFNESLGKLDQYLAGASPMPVPLAMLLNMQIGAIAGDPMLTGIDLAGDLAVFATMPQTDQGEPAMGILFPVTNYAEFVKTNPNCKPADSGLTLLSAPNSPVGNLMLAAVGEKYALVVPESEKTTIPTLQKALAADSKMSKRLSSAQSKEAVTSAAWVYVNIADLYEEFNQDALDAIEMAQMGMGQPGVPAEMMKFYFKMLPELFKEFAGDADSATIALSPEPTILTLDIALRAKDGSELAKMLVADKNTGDYKLTGYLDNTNAVNGLMKMNRPFMQTFYDKVFDIMAAATDDPESKKQTAEMKSLTQKMFAAMGDEVSFSFTYASGTPPFKMQEVVEIKDPTAMKAMMTEGMDYANTLYKSMGIPAELKYEPATSTYKGAAIDTISISIAESDDPNMVAMQKEIEKLYGDGLKYYMAQTSDKFYVTMGSDSEPALKALIDQPTAATAPSGDIKIAMDALQNTPYNDFVCSVNVIKLMKGMGEMMQSMSAQPGMGLVAAIFGGLEDIPTQSCLATGGKIADGQAAMRLAIPKQHLIEIVAVVMQIQQKMAATVTTAIDSGIQEAMAAPQGSAAIQEPPKNPLQDWVGKPAPEMKMVDLDGKTHRVSRLKGKKVILDFWATWCPPCKKAIPDLIQLRTDSKESELVIIGLSDEPADTLSPFVKDKKINYPIVASTKDLPAPYGQVTGIPTLFLIDSEGIIQDVLTGYHEPEDVQARLNKIN